MNKERAIYIGALILLFVGIFLVYEFYFSAKLAEYAQRKQLLDELRQTEARLKTAFGPADPDNVIRDYSGKMEAWNDAVAARIPFFNDAEWREHAKPPEDVFILQFWYGDQTTQMLQDLWEKAQQKYGPAVLERMPPGFPNSVQPMFGVAYAEQWQGLNIEAEHVNSQLEQLSYGISILELLMDKDALRIYHAKVDPLGDAGFAGNGIKYTRIQLSFMMEARALVSFLEELRQEDRFYSVEGMRISHPYILARYEPQLQVDMYLLRTTQDEAGVGIGASGVSAQASYAGNFGITAVAQDSDDSWRAGMPDEEPGTFGKAWKWFKRNVLFTN